MCTHVHNYNDDLVNVPYLINQRLNDTIYATIFLKPVCFSTEIDVRLSKIVTNVVWNLNYIIYSLCFSFGTYISIYNVA